MTIHWNSWWKKYFTQVKAGFFPEFPQHPKLLSAYIRELTPQYSAGSKLLPQQQKSVNHIGSKLLPSQQKLAKYPPSPAKVFIAEIPVYHYNKLVGTAAIVIQIILAYFGIIITLNYFMDISPIPHFFFTSIS